MNAPTTNNPQPITILVTGGSGLVGQHLLEALSASSEYQIKAIYRKHKPSFVTQIQDKKIEWIESDILDIPSLEQAFENVTHVYHCAAIVSYDPRMFDEMMEINIEGTANIVNLCLDKKVTKLCYVSSIATLGEAAAGNQTSEKDDWEPNAVNSNYALSKQGAEMEVWRGVAEGLDAVIVNPSVILGEGDLSRSSTNLFKIVYDEFPFYTHGATGWVDVKDLVRVMIALMKSDIKNDRFIVSAENVPFKEVFSMMANAMNKRPPYKPANRWMTELAWRFYYLKSIITRKTATITKESAYSAQHVKYYDHSKLLNALPEFRYTSLQESIKRIGTFVVKSTTI